MVNDLYIVRMHNSGAIKEFDNYEAALYYAESNARSNPNCVYSIFILMTRVRYESKTEYTLVKEDMR